MRTRHDTVSQEHLDFFGEHVVAMYMGLLAITALFALAGVAGIWFWTTLIQ